MTLQAQRWQRKLRAMKLVAALLGLCVATLTGTAFAIQSQPANGFSLAEVIVTITVGVLLVLDLFLIRLYQELSGLPKLYDALQERVVAIEGQVGTVDLRDTNSRHAVRNELSKDILGVETRLRDDLMELRGRVLFIEQKTMNGGRT